MHHKKIVVRNKIICFNCLASASSAESSDAEGEAEDSKECGGQQGSQGLPGQYRLNSADNSTSESKFASAKVHNDSFGDVKYTKSLAKSIGENHQDDHNSPCPNANKMYNDTMSSHGKISLPSNINHQDGLRNKNTSVAKASRDSGCFDDTSLTTLTINETNFPPRTSPTASDRSSHSTGLASHTDESGIHNMNEDCFF